MAALARHVVLRAPDKAEFRAAAVEGAVALALALDPAEQQALVGFVARLSRTPKVRLWAVGPARVVVWWVTGLGRVWDLEEGQGGRAGRSPAESSGARRAQGGSRLPAGSASRREAEGGKGGRHSCANLFSSSLERAPGYTCAPPSPLPPLVQVQQRLMAVELAPALLEAFDDPFHPVDLPQPLQQGSAAGAGGKTPGGGGAGRNTLLVDGQVGRWSKEHCVGVAGGRCAVMSGQAGLVQELAASGCAALRAGGLGASMPRLDRGMPRHA